MFLPPLHSFSFGAASLLNPSLGFDASFLEEPVMLLAFVLLGRAMEARAKVRAHASRVLLSL
jgi:Cu2+-exporting ATPase